MSNSNCSIGLQRLKPVHTAYGAICMPIRKLLMHCHHSSTSQLCIYSDGPDMVLGTRRKWPRPRRWQFFSRWDRDETLVRRDRDAEIETTTLRARVTATSINVLINRYECHDIRHTIRHFILPRWNQLHCVSKKFTLFMFCDHAVKCWPILIISGGIAAEKICKQITYFFLIISCSLCMNITE